MPSKSLLRLFCGLVLYIQTANAQIPVPELPPPPAPTPIAPPFAIAPTPVSAPSLVSAPNAQALVACSPAPVVAGGRTLVPITFFSNGIGASIGPLSPGRWRLIYFDKQLDFFPYQYTARINGAVTTLPAAPQNVNGQLYVPLVAFCEMLGLQWSQAPNFSRKPAYYIQFPAAYIKAVRSTVYGDKVRTVVTLSNATRVFAFREGLNVGFQLSGARDNSNGAIPDFQAVNDYLVTHTVLNSSNWNARFGVKMSYSAPVSWFTMGNPARIVIDVQRLFEQKSTTQEAGLTLTKIRRGTGHGPVQMWAVRLDPREGWRMRLTPAGYSVLQRQKISRLASRNKAVLAVNGGFFAYDGAAVGAVLVDNEWIRLPWGGRTALGFDANGKAHIANLQVQAQAIFSSGARLPIRDLNGWPDKGHITALTRRFGNYYALRAGEMAVVVKNGVVIATPGGGGANVPLDGFTLVASGAARGFLQKITRGQRAKLAIQTLNWPKVSTALGGGPRLLQNGKITVKDENFRSDVTNGTGPRTAFGVDKAGRYLILVADGRQKYYSTGLTLRELAATMQKLGAVNAMNLDGGGSTSMAVRGRVVNRPSDGSERKVANALLVMR